MFRLVTLLGLAAVTMAVVAANAASRESSKTSGDDAANTNDQASNRLPILEGVLPFHAPFSLN
jgi:hypothetical protein